MLWTTLNTALTRHYRGLWEYEFPVTEGDRGCIGGAWQQATQIWDLRLTGNTIATTRVGPEARRPRSKPESILLWAFLYPPFAPLLLRFSVLAGEQRERGTFPGAASFTAHGPKGSRAKHKGSGHCHSPQSPTILKATFQSKMPPPRLTLPHPLWTGTGQCGPPWDTSSGRIHVSTSATRRMWNTRRTRTISSATAERRTSDTFGMFSAKSMSCIQHN